MFAQNNENNSLKTIKFYPKGKLDSTHTFIFPNKKKVSLNQNGYVAISPDSNKAAYLESLTLANWKKSVTTVKVYDINGNEKIIPNILDLDGIRIANDGRFATLGLQPIPNQVSGPAYLRLYYANGKEVTTSPKKCFGGNRIGLFTNWGTFIFIADSTCSMNNLKPPKIPEVIIYDSLYNCIGHNYFSFCYDASSFQIQENLSDKTYIIKITWFDEKHCLHKETMILNGKAEILSRKEDLKKCR